MGLTAIMARGGMVGDSPVRRRNQLPYGTLVEDVFSTEGRRRARVYFTRASQTLRKW